MHRACRRKKCLEWPSLPERKPQRHQTLVLLYSSSQDTVKVKTWSKEIPCLADISHHYLQTPLARKPILKIDCNSTTLCTQQTSQQTPPCRAATVAKKWSYGAPKKARKGSNGRFCDGEAGMGDDAPGEQLRNCDSWTASSAARKEEMKTKGKKAGWGAWWGAGEGRKEGRREGRRKGGMWMKIICLSCDSSVCSALPSSISHLGGNKLVGVSLSFPIWTPKNIHNQFRK